MNWPLRASLADVLAGEVVTFTAAAKMHTSPRPSAGFTSSPAFDPAVSGPTRSAFDSIVLGQLLWPSAPRPSFEDCRAAVQRHSAVL